MLQKLCAKAAALNRNPLRSDRRALRRYNPRASHFGDRFFGHGAFDQTVIALMCQRRRSLDPPAACRRRRSPRRVATPRKPLAIANKEDAK